MLKTALKTDCLNEEVNEKKNVHDSSILIAAGVFIISGWSYLEVSKRVSCKGDSLPQLAAETHKEKQ